MNYKIIKFNIYFLILFILLGFFGFVGIDLIGSLNNKQQAKSKLIGESNSSFRKKQEAIASKDFGKEITINYYPDFASNIVSLGEDIIPINGISHIKTYFCGEQGFLSSYIADRHGFNNDDDIYNNSSLDIALIGDSYIHGACTNKNSVQQNLSNIHKDLSIISFANGGAGPLLELAYLKEYAINYKPKLVLWFWVGNDLRNLQDELASPLRFYMRDGYTQNLFDPRRKMEADNIVKKIFQDYKIEKSLNSEFEKSSQNLISIKQRIKSYFPKTFSLYRSLKSKTNYELVGPQNRILSRETVLSRSLPHSEDILMKKVAEKVLLEANNTIKSYGGEFVIIYLGFGGWESNKYINKNFERTHNLQKNFLSNFAKNQSINYYDLDNDIDDIFSSKDHINGHFSDAGYQLISKIISKYIQNMYSNSAKSQFMNY